MEKTAETVRAPISFEDQYESVRMANFVRDWQAECDRLPPEARPTLEEYVAEAIDAEAYADDVEALYAEAVAEARLQRLTETMDAAGPPDIEPLDWDSIPY